MTSTPPDGRSVAAASPAVRSRDPFNRVHRLLFFCAASVWFLAMVAAEQRNVQDTWILEDAFVPFVVLLCLFLYAAIRESDARIVAAMSSWMTVVANLIPSLKYVQPHGTTIDAVEHFLMVDSLMETGRVVSEHTYASIPGMHAWLSSFGLLAGLSPEQALQFGLPLAGGLMPLFVYFLCARSGLPSNVTKYTLLGTMLAMVPYYAPNGTGFTALPLVMLLALILLQAFDRESPWLTFVYVSAAVIGILQLVIWHSTTPMLLPLALLVGSLTPVALHMMDRTQGRRTPNISMIAFALITAVVFLAYHQLQQDRVHRAITEDLPGIFSEDDTEFGGEDTEAAPPPEIPSTLRRVTKVDALRALLALLAREVLVLTLAGIGLVVALRHRAQLSGSYFTYVFYALVLGVFAGLISFSILVGIYYGRFLLLSTVASPLFVGLALWWLAARRNSLPRVWKFVATGAAYIAIPVSVALWVVDVYGYQPLLPNLGSHGPDAPPDYLVWIPGVNSGYQERMLHFAESHFGQGMYFAGDLNTNRQYRRYFGIDNAHRRRLYAPLFKGEPLDTAIVDGLLLHWPGPAGGFAERAASRSVDRLQDLRDTPGWGLVYDNGESFVLLVRDGDSDGAEAGGDASID